MKNIFIKLLKVLAVIIIIFVVFFGIIFIVHTIANKKYEKNYKVPGDLIEVYDNEYIHAYSMGEGENTIVLLSGMGVPSPYYDFYSLATSLSKKNRVIIIEYFGYGYSSETEKERTIANYKKEIQAVLDYYLIKDNIILAAHSFSGPISMSYANEHDSVIGYVCLDCSSAYQAELYIEQNTEYPDYPDSYALISKSGLTRFLGAIVPGLISEFYLEDVPEKMINDYKYFIYNKLYNKTVIHEMEAFPKIETEMLNVKYRDNLKVVTFLAKETVDSMQEYYEEGDFKYDFKTMHEKEISNSDIQKIYVLEGSHFVYHTNVDKITETINNMIYGEE